MNGIASKQEQVGSDNKAKLDYEANVYVYW
jgi:hypothetical protein